MLSFLTGLGMEFTCQHCFQRDLYFFPFLVMAANRIFYTRGVLQFTKQKAVAFPSAVCPTIEDLSLCVSVSKQTKKTNKGGCTRWNMILMKKVWYSHLMPPCHKYHFIMTDSSRPVGWRKQRDKPWYWISDSEAPMSGQHEKHCGPADYVLKIFYIIVIIIDFNHSTSAFLTACFIPSSTTEALTSICFACSYSMKIHHQASYFCTSKSQANHEMCYGCAFI